MAGENQMAETAGAERKISIRLRILTLIALLVALLVVERMFSLLSDRELQINAAEDNLLEVAHRAALSQQEAFASAHAVLEVLVGQARWLNGRPTDCGPFLERLNNEMIGIQGIYLAGRGGTVVCSNVASAVGTSLFDQDFFRTVTAETGVVMSPLFTDKVTGLPSLVLARTQRDAAGRVEAVAAVGLDLQWLSRLAARTGSAQGMTVEILDTAGVVVVRYPALPEVTNRNFSKHPLVKAALSADDGLASVPGFDGKERIFAFVRFEGTNVRILVGQERDRILGPIDQRLMSMAIGYVVALFIFIGVAWVAAERLVIRPINRLAAAVGAMDRDEMVAIDDMGVREFEPLVRAFRNVSGRLSDHNEQLRQINGRLAALARTDGLTGLANRRTFDVQFSEDWVASREDERPLAVALIDVDHFKLFNDTRGHLAGDDALRAVARMLTAAVAGTDYLAARYGGEEFVVLLPGADMADALSFAEDVRRLIAALAIQHPAAPTRRITASIGVASVVPTDEDSPDALMSRADMALYDAKRQGRNRVASAVQMVAQ